MLRYSCLISEQHTETKFVKEQSAALLLPMVFGQGLKLPVFSSGFNARLCIVLTEVNNI